MLCENCIVDASIFIFCFVSKSCSPAASVGSFGILGGVVVVCLCKGTWWMPWHQEADEGRERLRNASGSCQLSVDPRVSEWGNLAVVMGGRRQMNS